MISASKSSAPARAFSENESISLEKTDMKAVTLYSAPSQLTAQHHPVSCAPGVIVWVRGEVRDYPGSEDHLSDAMMDAEPLPDETLLNTIDVPPAALGASKS